MNDLISIVIPFYNGNKHLQNLKATIDANYTDLGSIARLEVILVNVFLLKQPDSWDSCGCDRSCYVFLYVRIQSTG